MIRLIVAGTRNFDNYEFLKSSLDEFIDLHTLGDINPGVVIISGMAKGADLLGVQYAKERNYQLEEFPADWTKGRSAGPQRNLRMAKSANACVVFWDGKSKGTENMISIAKRHELKLQVVHYNFQ